MISSASPPADSSTAVRLAYLQLFRLPNLFTAIADVMMGFLFVHQSLQPVSRFGCLVAASCLLYTAGMVLNDVFDYEIDRRERPERPLPSGRISRTTASALGWGMLVLGASVAWGGGVRSGCVATCLAVAIVLYDAVLKPTWLGPLAMGSCRMLNVLLGMSLLVDGDPDFAFGFSADQWMVAAGIGVYIVGVTWFARSEARTSQRGPLMLGLGIMLAGIGLLAAFPLLRSPTAPLMFTSAIVWPCLLLLLMVSVVRRCALAIARPEPQLVQMAVKQSILSLIVLDAAVCLAVSGPIWAMLVLALLLPTVLLGRWVYST